MNFKKIVISILLAGVMGTNLLGMLSEKYVSGCEADDERSGQTVDVISREDITNLLHKNGLDLDEYWDSRPLSLLNFEEQEALLALPATSEPKRFPETFNAYMRVLQAKIGQIFANLKNRFKHKSFNEEYTLPDFFEELGIQINQVNLLPKKHSVVAQLDPVRILEAIEFMIISYFSPNNLNKRLNKGDKFIFDLPKIFISIRTLTPENIEISGYYDKRQDVYFPEDVQEAIADEPSKPSLGKIIKVGLVIMACTLPLFHQAILKENTLEAHRSSKGESQNNNQPTQYFVPQTNLKEDREAPCLEPLDIDNLLIPQTVETQHDPNGVFVGTQADANEKNYDVCMEENGLTTCYKIENNILIKVCTWDKHTQAPILCKSMDLSKPIEKCYEIKANGDIYLCGEQEDLVPKKQFDGYTAEIMQECLSSKNSLTDEQVTSAWDGHQCNFPLAIHCPNLNNFIRTQAFGMFPWLNETMLKSFIIFDSSEFNAHLHKNQIYLRDSLIKALLAQKHALQSFLAIIAHEIGHANQDDFLHAGFDAMMLDGTNINIVQQMKHSEKYNIETRADLYSALVTSAHEGVSALNRIHNKVDFTVNSPQANPAETLQLCDASIEIPAATSEMEAKISAVPSQISALMYHPTTTCRFSRILKLGEEKEKTKKEFKEYRQTYNQEHK